MVAATKAAAEAEVAAAAEEGAQGDGEVAVMLNEKHRLEEQADSLEEEAVSDP